MKHKLIDWWFILFGLVALAACVYTILRINQ